MSEVYKQHVYHFNKINSINVHKITDEQIDYCLKISQLKFTSGAYKSDSSTARKMIADWFPEYFI